MFTRFASFLVIAGFASAVSAADLGAATFTEIYAKPSASGVGVAYFTVTSAKNDSIVGLSSNCCKAVELHRTEKLNGIMSMRRIAELSLDKKKPMRVQPDAEHGEHMMLLGLKSPLEVGDSVTVTFTFKKAGQQTVTFPVRGASDTVGNTSGAEHGHH